MTSLFCDAISSAMAGASFFGWNCWIGEQLNSGTHNAIGLWLDDDRTIHFGKFAQTSCGELDIEDEATTGGLFHYFVVTKDDQAASATTQNTLKAVPKGGSWCYLDECITQDLCWFRGFSFFGHFYFSNSPLLGC